MRSVGADLPWYKYYLVDVGLILFTAFALFVYVMYWVVLTVFCKIGLIANQKQARKKKHE